MRTLIIGASDKPERYANKALHMLKRYGHEVVLVHPTLKTIEGHSVVVSPNDVTGEVHTVTMYVNPSISDSMESAIITLHPKRVIFNPGSENSRLAAALKTAGIAVLDACTLVLLQTKQY